MTYRAGVIGCGRIGYSFGGTKSHAGSYMAVDGVDLVAVCDRKLERAEQCAKDLGVKAYQDYYEMLGNENLDIVSICTPPNNHCQSLHGAVGNGSVKAIYCEKPISVGVYAAERMVQSCNAFSILLMVNHQRRFGPLHQEIARIIREGELGRIQQVTCYYGRGVSNSGSHLFDLLRFYLGDVKEVDGWWSPNSSHQSNDPNIDGWLWFEGNVPVAIQACDGEAYLSFEINIMGILGRIRILSAGRRGEIEYVIDHPDYPGFRELSMPQILSQSSPQAPSQWIPRGVEHIIDCLETGRQPISSGEDGLAALRIIEALISSARQKGG